MNRILSQNLHLSVQTAVREAISTDGVVNVPHLAETIRLLHSSENVAREDIELLVLQNAQVSGAAMSFAPVVPQQQEFKQ